MQNKNKNYIPTKLYYTEELPSEHDDLLIKRLHQVIKLAVKVLAILMVCLILWGVADVVLVLYKKLTAPPFLLLSISDILETFGAFLAVLIAIEIFLNITIYVRKDLIPVKLVVATALMAIARKVIIFDFKELSPMFIFGTAATVVALGVTYWLVAIDKGGNSGNHN